MYGKGVGTLNVATGVSLLPETGNNRPLFVAALGLLVSGVVVFAVAALVSRKQRALN